MATFIVGAGGFSTIQSALDAAKVTPGGPHIVSVEAGDYNESVYINFAVTLVSATPGAAKITAAGEGQNAVTIDSTSNVRIEGFNIVGTTTSNDGNETAAVYLRGANSNISIVNNTIQANGEAAILDEYNAGSTNIVVTGNTIGGNTFDGAAPLPVGHTPSNGVDFPGGANQWNSDNVARQLVVLGQGNWNTTNGSGNPSSNITFSDNIINGNTGVGSVGNGLVNIEGNNSTVSGNIFNGNAATFELRARGNGTTISDNTFSSPTTTSVVTGPNTGAVTGSTFGGTLANEVVNGTTGNDTFIGSGGDDTFNGLGGFDTVDYSASTETLSVTISNSGGGASGNDIGNDVFSSIEKVIGGSGDDSAQNSSNSSFTFQGGAGDDLFTGSTSAGAIDTYVFGAGVIATEGMATRGSGPARLLFTAEGNDTLRNVDRITFASGQTFDVVNNNVKVLVENDTANLTEPTSGHVIQVNTSVLDDDINLDQNIANGDVKAVGTLTPIVGTYGTVQFAADGTYTYTLNAAGNALKAGQLVVETINYSVTDGTNASAAVLTINLTGTNDAPSINFKQDFSDNADGINSGGQYGGLNVVNSFGSIVAADGGDFAVVTKAGSGPFTRFGAYSSDFVDGATAEVKVYLDTSWAVGEGFDYSVAANGQNGNHLRDFVFHVVQTSTGLVIGADNNGNTGTNLGLNPTGATPVPASGWYTLQHVFGQSSGALSVTMNLIDSNGDVVGSWVRSDPADLIASVAGGNRYGWFNRIEVPSGIAVDDYSLEGVATATVFENGDLDQGAQGVLNGDLATAARNPAEINYLNDLFAGNPSTSAVFTYNMEAILADAQVRLGPNAGQADAIAYVWDFLNKKYFNGGTPAINEAFGLLGIEYADYLAAGGRPLDNIVAKHDPASGRVQSLHDNLLGNLRDSSLQQRWDPTGTRPNVDDNPAMYNAFKAVLLADHPQLLNRPYFEGSVGENQAPSLAHDKLYGYRPDASGALIGYDPDGDTLVWSAAADTDNDGAVEGTYGTFRLNANGTWTYTIDNALAATQGLREGETKQDSFSVVLSDGQGGSDTTTVTVNVVGSNDAPVAVAVTRSVTEQGTVVAGTDTASGTLVANDPDALAGELVWSGGGSGLYGAFTVDAQGNWQYVLDNGAANSLPQGATPTEVFTVTATDAFGAKSTTTVTITVNGSNDAPVADVDVVTASAYATPALAAVRQADEGPIYKLEESYNLDPALRAAINGLTTDPTNFDAVFADTKAAVGEVDAFVLLWDVLDLAYSYGNSPVNASNILLGIEYAQYLIGGGVPLTGIVAKYDVNGLGEVTRNQSIHDNILGNFSAAYDESNRFTPEHRTLLNDRIDTLNLEFLHDREWFSGYVGQPSGSAETLADVRSFDLDKLNVAQASGKLVATDVDNDLLSWAIQGETPVAGVTTQEGIYGTLTVNADGTWSYSVNDSDPDTLALGSTAQVQEQDFVVVVSDGNGGLDTTTIKITINGTNQAPQIDDALNGETFTIGEGDTVNATALEVDALLAQYVSDADAGDTVTLTLKFSYAAYPGGTAPADHVITVVAGQAFTYTPPNSSTISVSSRSPLSPRIRLVRPIRRPSSSISPT